LANLSLAVRERLNRAEQTEELRLSLELHPLEAPDVKPIQIDSVSSEIIVIDLS
jgi:hypothetical protein